MHNTTKIDRIVNAVRCVPVVLLMIAWSAIFVGCACSHQTSTAPTTCVSAHAQTTFNTPQQAVTALVNAMRSNNSAKLQQILGPDSSAILSSGDKIADTQHRQKFLSLYDQKHELNAGENGEMTLSVGPNDWPMPIPLVKQVQDWRFDTHAGLEEILNRRIGRNERDATQVCLAIVDAERDYVQHDPDGDNIPDYAQKFFSDPGQKNGLYWPTNPGEQPSPLGPLVGEAADQGYTRESHVKGKPQPYHGYFYHILKSQGPHAEGGACDYIVNGKMIGGFALIAYPAQYGNSGIMTFLVDYRGIVYQKDLGPDTATVARSIAAYDPDSSWQKAR